MTNACHQLLERVSSKNMVNTCKKEYGEKLHLGELTSTTCVPKGEQVWVFGSKRLSPLKKKYYKSCKQQLLDRYHLMKLFHLYPERQASVAFKALRGAHLK